MLGTDPFSHLNYDDSWRREQVRALRATLPLSIAASSSIALIVMVLQWGLVGATATLIWAAALICVTAGRLAPFLFKWTPETSNARNHAWLRAFRIGNLGGGLVWALGVYLMFTWQDIPHQALLAFAVGGVCAAAASTFAIDRISVIAFTGPPITTMIVHLIAAGSDIGLSMAVMLALYFSYLIVNGRRSSKWLRELTDLRTESTVRAERLSVSEARYQDLVENSTDLIHSATADGILLFVNRTWCETLGYSYDSIVGRHVEDFVLPHTRGRRAKTIDRILAGEDIGPIRIDFLSKDKKIVTVEGHITVRMEAGKPVSTRAILRDVTDRLDAERKLTENERLLDSIIENLPAMIFLKSAHDLRFERLNRAGQQLLGYSSEELNGQTDREMWPENQADHFQAVDRQLLEGSGATKVIEETISTKSGEIRHLRTSKIALRDEDGRPAHILGLSIDITEQKRAQEDLRRLNADLENRVAERTIALADSEQFIRSTIDALRARVAVLDEHGKVITTNASWRRFGGDGGMAEYSVQEGDSYLEACEQLEQSGRLDEAGEIAEAVRDVIAGRRNSVSVEHKGLAPEDERWFLCHVSRFESGASARVVVTHDDVTDVHIAREQAAVGARMIASLDAVAPVGIFRLDAEGNTKSVNQRYCEITGLTWDELLDDGWRRAVHPDDIERVIKSWNIAMRTHSPVQVEYRFVHSDGTIVWVIGQTVEIVDPSGKIAGYVGTLTDITERRALEMQLAQAVKMEAIGKLTGGIAHDFNNFLGIIMGNLDLLRERLGDDPTTNRLIDAALRGATRSADLTRSLLAFSRQQPLDPRLANVSERLETVIELITQSLGEAVELSTSLAEDIWLVRVDGTQFDSCILNMAKNASDAMPRGGRLSIVTRNVRLDEAYVSANPETSAGDHVLIEIADTGAGMSPETIARAFEPFYTTKPAGHGTGLGLSMVYGFVKQSGGHIDLYSEPGHGTTVRIYLPRDRHSSLAATEQMESNRLPMPMGTETVLLVEDNEQFRETAMTQLRSLGYTVIEADSGDTALPILQRSPRPDILFSDIVMPGSLNGFALAARAREICPGIGILLTSGFPGDTLRRNVPQDPDLPLLSKPYRKEELARALRDVLDSPAP